ncbi:GAT domain-containing protein [Histoplasma capsulatum]|uniref:GAT domain-containing protein n=1 Tax=Ajellomyces capsulatus TaxID=5037 RepID=A0A8A1MKY3_AJECA|nr:GAT domain-containing protein [Histoplasma capsulatum]
MGSTLTPLQLLFRSAQSAFRASSHPPDSPEAIILAELTSFCESGGPNNTGDEYLHLPAIVEAAESSPAAAKAAADTISRVLSNPASKKGYKQYNAIMLIRILSDNPGTTFTRNFDGKFVSITKNLLREGRDMSVQQILRETLEFLAVQKSHDTNVAPLVEMWKKEKLKFEKAMGVSAGPWVQPLIPGQRDDYFARSHRSSGLPSPEELSARITEANISASLLLQFVQSTPTAEFYTNDLLKEFSARCQAAAKSIQGYINATNPSPDEDTMLTLIETNDRLSAAFSKYQRAAVVARRNASRTDSQEAVPPALPPLAAPQQQPLYQAGRAPQNFEVPKNTNHSNPNPNPTPTSTSTSQSPPLQSAVSPLAITPPSFPLSNNLNRNNSLTNPSRTTALTSHALHNNNDEFTSSSYQYNSSEFQVENPFADTYSSPFPDDNTNSNHSTVTTTTTSGRHRGPAAGPAADRNTDEDTTPMTSSTYYPDARNVMVDGNMPGAAIETRTRGRGLGV